MPFFYPFSSGSEGEGDVDKYKLDEPEPDDSENEERVERLRNERVKRMAEIREKKRAERAKPEAEISDGEVDSGMVQTPKTKSSYSSFFLINQIPLSSAEWMFA